MSTALFTRAAVLATDAGLNCTFNRLSVTVRDSCDGFYDSGGGV